MKVLETDAVVHLDGSLKLLSPLPPWLKPGQAHVFLSLEGPRTGESGVEREERTHVTPRPGSLKGFKMAPDFDDPLEDFKDYMG